ncbi:hypothetical protein NQ318_003028 [Aromia moschata]|uniref:Uncharacterized protein n=1 Tax=Aromia moschata TaxID=1265417 RepID=A0AAV8YPH1_9CUCU|nr:hypothetical protein NQ318_003028 [Aromia moschata]
MYGAIHVQRLILHVIIMSGLEDKMMNVTKVIEKQVDTVLERLDNLDVNELEQIRLNRIKELQKQEEQKKIWLGNRDDFTTEHLEWRIAQHNIINYEGDLSTPPHLQEKKSKESSKKIRDGFYNRDDDDLDTEEYGLAREQFKSGIFYKLKPYKTI